MLDECYNIIHDGCRHRQLTLKYYAQKVYCFINANLNFLNKWKQLSQTTKKHHTVKHASHASDGSNSNNETQFDYLNALCVLASSIPTVDRIDEDSLQTNLKVLYDAVEELILQHKPSILRKIVRGKGQDEANRFNSKLMNSSECVLIIKQVHDVVVHNFGFRNTDSTVYKGTKYCIDKVLMCRVGDYKILTALEVHLAQYFGVCCEIHDYGPGGWKIFYHGSDGSDGYYECLHCQQLAAEQQENIVANCICCSVDSMADEAHTLEDPCDAIAGPSHSDVLPFQYYYPLCSPGLPYPPGRCTTTLTEVLFHRSVLESLVNNFGENLQNEWESAGGPQVYNLLDEDTFSTSMRNIFSAWRHVEHWKIAQLRHYTLLLDRVADDPTIEGDPVHSSFMNVAGIARGSLNNI